MVGMTNARFSPMKAAGIENFVERAYRESGKRQYIRELVVNSIESGATQIEIRPDRPQDELVTQTGNKRTKQSPNPKKTITRLVVADNGSGMSADELTRYMNTFGKSGKALGGAHENFGVGAKTSIMPWNHFGMVVCSWTKETPNGVMIQMEKHNEAYGLKVFEDDDGELASAIEPLEEYEALRPTWLKTGTMTILLGNTGTESTFFADEDAVGTHGHRTYLDDRFWVFPDGVKAYVWQWNPDKTQADRWIRREVLGAEKRLTKNVISSKGTRILKDGSTLQWFLASKVSASDVAASGHISALYKNELYDRATTQGGNAMYRRFGISYKSVRDLVSIVITPKHGSPGGESGVYPNTARSQLMHFSPNNPGKPLPWDRWGQEFSSEMPPEISAALLKVSVETSDATSDSEIANLAKQYGARWGTFKYAMDPKGKTPTPGPDPTDGFGSGNKGRQNPPGKEKNASEPKKKGVRSATKKPAMGGMPACKACFMVDIDSSRMFGAMYSSAPTVEAPNGTLFLAVDFPVFQEQLGYHLARYPANDMNAFEIEKLLKNSYFELLLSRVLHIQSLTQKVDRPGFSPWSKEQVDSLLTPEALTFSMMGCIAEDRLMSGKCHQNPVLTNKLKVFQEAE